MLYMSNIHEILSLFVLFLVYLTTPAFRDMLKSWMFVNNEFKGVQKKWQWFNLRYFPDTLKKTTKYSYDRFCRQSIEPGTFQVHAKGRSTWAILLGKILNMKLIIY